MHDNLAQQISQMLADNHTLTGRVMDCIGGAVTVILLWLGTVGGQFALIFDPTTWTMQTIASFCSIPVPFMYLLKLRAEKRLADQLRKNAEAAQDGDNSRD